MSKLETEDYYHLIVPVEFKEKIRRYCYENNITRVELFELLWDAYFENDTKKKGSR
jgi:hypothetical protein